MLQKIKNMILKKTIIISVILALLVFPIMALAVDTPPATPLTVYGDVKINNANAPIGTLITVFNGATEVARTTTSQAGKYFLDDVPASNAGITLTYKVNGTVATERTAADPVSVASDKIDLAVTTPVVSAPAPAPSSSGGSSGGTTSSNNAPATTTATPTPTPDTTPTAPTVPSTPTTVTPQVLGVKISAAEAQVNKILGEAGLVSARNWGSIVREVAQEKNTEKKYLQALIKGLKAGALTDEQKSALIEFITYGTETTKVLGAGERAGTANSYKAAFGKLPKTEADWADAIKIANGRWPNQRSTTAETGAKTSFKKIYGREANMDNQNDNAAVTVMAYGLRPSNRNLNSEKAAILAFKYFIKHAPVSAIDWDTVRAIAYSGAKR